MQHPAVPELAHNTTRPIHWLATAAALAAVIAGSSFLQPDPATAAQPGSEPSGKIAAAPAPATAPDAATVTYPLACGSVKPVVKKKASGDLDGDGRPETVAVVHCAAGSGTPPDGVYVVTRPARGKPRVVATLVDPKDRQNVSDFAVRDGVITATLLGYSSPSVPSCCPDLQDEAKWQWKDGTFARSTPAEAHSV